MRTSHVLSLVIVALLIPAIVGCQEPQAAKSTTVETQSQQQIVSPDQADQTQTDAPATGDTASAEKKDAPNVTVEDNEHNFGIVGPGTVHKTEFEFKNTGSKPLKVIDIKSTCSCTVPALKKKTYEPGESGKFSVTYTASEHEGTDKKHLYILSNDPDEPRKQVTIQAKIELDIEYGPQRMNLSLKEDNAGIPNITLKSKDGEKFAVKSFSTVRDVITANLDPDKKASEFTIKPKVNLEKLSKNLTGSITLTLDHPTTKRLRIFYTTQPLFEVTPARIIFQNAQRGETMKRTILIKSNYAENLKVESVESRDGQIEVVNRKSLGDRAQLEVEFTAPEDNKGRFFSDKLTINLENGEKLEINASGWIKK
ncbi:hypothetical protein STSP2_02827 [Anaerohalosphaera lusitana]|uniref:DUF1573 domain-containing protein n=1 Tax=Anaerohalosphaera lusitana TaxID=1936003 RepID=A0A1U9NNZ2_9BACT|nr:DUF1573 domain-containing protein [Anaerohalosphaera lusitana]AQT69633.1 hypothetical protein STSP2_02827 [Anaerohalosphaera lusitana]